MTETTQILLLSLACFVVAYAALPFIVRPKWKNLHRMANGRNSLFFIHVDPAAPSKFAVLAHELAEWKYKYRRPWLWLRWRSDKAQRKINLWGPAVETAYAATVYGKNPQEFARKEARAMAHRSYFAGWSNEEIKAEIDALLPKAYKWVDAHLKEIER